MNPKINKIIVRNFRRIREAEVSLSRGKLLLIGPHNGGKSSFIYAFLTLVHQLTTHENTIKFLQDFIDPAGEIRHGSDSAVIEVEADRRYTLTITQQEAKLDTDGRDISDVAEIKISYVGACNVRHWRYEDEYDICHEHLEVEDPEIAEHIRSALQQFFYGADFYYDNVKLHGAWYPFSKLAYGYKRLLGILFASYGPPDVLVVEAFEAGIHYDLARDLIDYLDRVNSFVIVESHVMLSAIRAIELSWDVYYVDEGEFTPLTSKEALKKAAEREASAYA